MGDDKDSLYTDAAKGKKKPYHQHPGNNVTTTKFEGGTEDIKNDGFILGKDMGNVCLKSKKVFIGYIGKKHRASEQQSLEEETQTIISVKQPNQIIKAKLTSRRYSTTNKKKRRST